MGGRLRSSRRSACRTDATRGRLRDVPLRRECRRERAAATDDTPGARVQPSWSADGKTIRYGRSLVRADGSGSSELPRNVPLAGAWSPDGQRIAVVRVAHSSAEARNPTKLGLWVMNADGSNARRVARKATSGEPAWSPNGRRIAFRRYDGQARIDRGTQTSLS